MCVCFLCVCVCVCGGDVCVLVLCRCAPGVVFVKTHEAWHVLKSVVHGGRHFFLEVKNKDKSE